MNATPRTYKVSDFECNNADQLLHVNGTINSELWNGFPPRWARIIRVNGVRRDDGRWTVSMQVAVDPDEWAIRLKDGETSNLYRPYQKADFGSIIPADVVLTEMNGD